MVRKKGGKKGPPKKSAYKRPPPIPKGEVIVDTFTNKTWTLGETVGVGGFGDIYSACPNEGPEKGLYNYVVKVEPQENGPLFVEKHFYIRNAKESDIKDYMKANKLKSLGMPTFFGHGFHEYNGEKYRYLVLPRYGSNIWDHFEKCKLSFSPDTVFLLGLQMLEVLNYIHERGYVHADIKGGNILMGLKKGTENQAYLLDYGLATRLTNKEYVEDPKAAHDGTLEYISRDGHKGAQTIRGDLEILGYNMLQWLVGKLPWEKSTYQPSTVMNMKKTFMQNVRENIQKDYPNVPEALIRYFEFIDALDPMAMPDYTKCQKIFLDYLKSVGKDRNSKLVFKPYNLTDNGPRNIETNDAKAKETGNVEVKKRGKKPKAKDETEISETVQSDDVEGKAVKDKRKRNNNDSEPIAKVKKMRIIEPVTPPAKENHANIATQTSANTRRSPRFVCFDSPISEVISDKRTNDNGVPVADTSADIFDESFPDPEKKRVGKKRKLLSTKEETVTRVVKRKVTAVKKGKSWKDAPAIVNGKTLQN